MTKEIYTEADPNSNTEERTMKLWPKGVLIVYLLVLLWLLLFKFSTDIFSILLHHQSTSLTLVPFMSNQLREMADNFAFFVPLGLLIGINYKTIGLRWKLAFIFALSLIVEATQFVLAIGAADITDVIMNTSGGLAGLVAYDVVRKHSKNEKLGKYIDVAITVLIAALLAVLLFFRIFVLKVRY